MSPVAAFLAGRGACFGNGFATVKVLVVLPTGQQHFVFRQAGRHFAEEVLDPLALGNQPPFCHLEGKSDRRTRGHADLVPGGPMEARGSTRGSFGLIPIDQLREHVAREAVVDLTVAAEAARDGAKPDKVTDRIPATEGHQVRRTDDLGSDRGPGKLALFSFEAAGVVDPRGVQDALDRPVGPPNFLKDLVQCRPVAHVAGVISRLDPGSLKCPQRPIDLNRLFHSFPGLGRHFL